MAKSDEHLCIADGCVLSGKNQIGVRVRVAHDGESPFPHKGRTDAIFSIESDAYLCDKHALGGGTLSLFFEPDDSEDIRIEVAADKPVATRSKHIRQPEEFASA
jgi:hypothetical protein